MGAKDFHISDQQLAEILGVTLKRLYDVVDIFDADPNDKWELREGDHFEWQVKSLKSRRFSEVGALVIAKYLDSIEKKSLWSKLKDWLSQKKVKITKALVEIRIHENCSSLTKQGDRHFLSKKDVMAIFATNSRRLEQAFEDIKKTDKPLILGYDFADIEGQRYFSLSGVEKLSRNLSEKLTSADRKLWCSAVSITGTAVVKSIVDAAQAKKQRVQRARDQAKRRDRNTCRITGAKRSNITPNISVAAHHIYDDKTYPHLAESPDNLITVTDEIHKEFHQWMGGTQVSCTLEDFINYVVQFHPESPVKAHLINLKKVLKAN